MGRKLKQSELTKYKLIQLKNQNYKCAICNEDLKNINSRNIHYDHNHKLGFLRGVLCKRCNLLEGKVYNIYTRYTPNTKNKNQEDMIRILKGLILYYKNFTSDLLHPSFKSEEEKRVLRNKRARLKRKRLKNGSK